MKISREDMKRREEIARQFFARPGNENATVQELNEFFVKRGEKRMGARAYQIRTEARKTAAKRGGRAAGGSLTAPNHRFPRIGVPTPTLVPPSAESDAKLAQDVMGILTDLAARLSGSKIQSIFLNVSTPTPVVKLMELEPREREVTLGSAPAPRATVQAPAPQAAPQPAPSNVTQLPSNGGNNGNQPQPPAAQ